MRAYLDHNASMPLRPEAREAMLAALDIAANPSSVHSEGRAARRVLEDARRDVAALVGADPARVFFTSGATEGAAWLATPNWTMGRAPLRFSKFHVGATEHVCLLRGGRFDPADVTSVPVDHSGLIDLEMLERQLAAHDHGAGLPLVAIQAANNETGVVQPVDQIAAMVREAKGVLVVDAVQAAGRLPIDLSAGFGDCLILSSHKIGGPKGVGAVVSASDVMMPVPLIPGGGQERGHRGGTENLAGIAGFGAAARQALSQIVAFGELDARRQAIEAAIHLAIPDVVIHGRDAPRLPNTIFFSIPGMKAETAQIAFDLAGIAVSAGSACSSGKVAHSHVLAAMGLVEPSAIRVSFGVSTGDEVFAAFTGALNEIAARRAGRQAA